ncbi:hypothetical protein HY213_05135 [Candidatus Peregrinibacteria bacterium]|nr:hypothetical protein [Candidatus Peregrinibacteria bacterium]
MPPAKVDYLFNFSMGEFRLIGSCIRAGCLKDQFGLDKGLPDNEDVNFTADENLHIMDTGDVILLSEDDRKKVQELLNYYRNPIAP